MVEARGVEPLSENKFMGLSPSAVDDLTFPPRYAGQQAYRFSSFMVHDALKALRVHVLRLARNSRAIGYTLRGYGVY